MDAKYIVIDGIDGGGKGALFVSLEQAFPMITESQQRFIYTREPGGTLVGEKLRKIIVGDHIHPLTEFFLLLAQRKEVRDQVVSPAIARGTHVISDRSDSSTFAYQIRGHSHAKLEKQFWELRELLAPHPTLYIFLDLDPELAAQRRSGRQKPDDRFDAQDLVFFTQVRDGFIEFGAKVDTPCHFVDASRSKEAVATEVIELIKRHIGSSPDETP